jgi:hypothetical protein
VSKNKFIFITLSILGAFLVFFAGTVTGRSTELRKSEELAERIAELPREDRDRQQRIAALARESVDIVDRARETTARITVIARESIDTVDQAKRATERIAFSTGAARDVIREAIGLIEQAAKDYEKLQADLDSLCAGIVGIGSVNSQGDMEITDDHRKD